MFILNARNGDKIFQNDHRSSTILNTYHNEGEDQANEEETGPVHWPCKHVRCRARVLREQLSC